MNTFINKQKSVHVKICPRSLFLVAWKWRKTARLKTRIKSYSDYESPWLSVFYSQEIIELLNDNWFYAIYIHLPQSVYNHFSQISVSSAKHHMFLAENFRKKQTLKLVSCRHSQQGFHIKWSAIRHFIIIILKY